MAISRMQEPSQLYGLGSLRQPYGLGKLVKKAFKGVKKIAKSPIGKAALIGGLGWAANAGKLGGIGTGWWGKMKGLPFIKSTGAGLGNWWGGLSGGQKIFTGLAGAGIAAPFIQKALGYGPYEDEEEEEQLSWTQTPQSILDIRNMARNQDPSLAFLPKPDYVQSGFYNLADGGRAGLLNGGEAGKAQMEQMLLAEYMKYKNKGGTLSFEKFVQAIMQQQQEGQAPNQMMTADAGRAGYYGGELVEQETDFIQGPQGDEEFSERVVEEVGATDQQKAMVMDMLQRGMDHATIAAVTGLEEADVLSIIQEAQAMAQGGRAGYLFGDRVEQQTDFIEGPGGTEEFDETLMASDPGAGDDMNQVMEFFSLKLYGKSVDQLSEDEYLNLQESLPDLMSRMTGGDTEFAAQGGRIGAQEGGLMDLGGQEKDYRDEGGFVALGGEERADDVPARLSKNEFVFTADAVRNAGGGDIDRGSEVMQNMMDNLEAGGEISEESQGLEGVEDIMSEEIIDESNPAQEMYDNYEQLQSRVI